MAGRDTTPRQLGKYVLLLTVAAGPILLFASPLFLIILKSLSDGGSYVKFFSSQIYLKSLKNSLFIASASTLLISPIGLFIVSAIRKQNRTRRIVKILTSMPLVFSSYVFCIALIYIYGRAGIVNYVLGTVGLSFPANLLYSTTGIIFANVLFFLPYFIIPLFSAFEELNPSIEEAAESLGSTGIHKFAKIIFPQILHGFLTGALTTFLLVFSQISVVLALGAGRTYTLTYLLFAQYEGFQFGMANAMAVISIGVTVLVTISFHVVLRGVWRGK